MKIDCQIKNSSLKMLLVKKNDLLEHDEQYEQFKSSKNRLKLVYKYLRDVYD